jgi:hypothetical protein
VNLIALLATNYKGSYESYTNFGCLGNPFAVHAMVLKIGDCLTKCRTDARCGAGTYTAASKQCSLKPSCDYLERVNNVGNVSFVKSVFTPLTEAEFIALTLHYHKLDSWRDRLESASDNTYEFLEVLLSQVSNTFTDAINTTSITYIDLPGKSCLRDTLSSTTTDNLDSCKNKCSGDDICGAFTYNTVTKHCYLKPSCRFNERANKVDNISGVKEGFLSNILGRKMLSVVEDME